MAKIVICDKCKKELKYGNGFNGSLWGIDKHINIDLCNECAKDVAEYIGTTIELEKAYNKGYYDALQRQSESEESN